MQANEKRGLLGKSVLAVKIVLYSLFVFIGFIFIYYCFIEKNDFLTYESVRFIENWTVDYDDGSVISVGRSYTDADRSTQKCTIRSVLPSDISDNEFVFFTTRKDIAVYINDELREDFVEKRDVKLPGGSVKRFYMAVPLKNSDSGAVIKIVRLSDEKEEQIVPETFIGTRSGALGYLMKHHGASFILAFIILLFSFVVFVISIVLRFRYKTKIDMMYGTLGIFVIAAWIITDSYIWPFIFGVMHVNDTMNYMFALMLPLAPAVYLNSVRHSSYRKSSVVVLIVVCINAVGWTLLHFTGILSLEDARNIENLILGGMAVTGIVILSYDVKKGYSKGYRYTLIGFFGFLICGIIELLLILLSNGDTTLPMVIGLGFLLTFVVIQQVYDLRKINIEKQHAIDISEAKTKFLASMSHEIRTPINAILGMNEMILRENRDHVIGEYSRSIKTSGKMLLMLVNDVLDFSKIEAGKLEINENRFHISDMLRDVISLIKERADEKDLELKTEIAAKIPDEMISDEFRLRQILVNLLNNSVKYTEKGTVTLALGGDYSENGFNLKFSVKDTGKGIKQEDQDRLFDAFSRADMRTNANVEGTGLGLAIVKSIVDSMKGNIEVYSEYGVGSEFTVTIPVKYKSGEFLESDFAERKSEDASVYEQESFTAPDAKILAVDDNQSNLTIVKLFLKRTGIVPDLCSSGEKAAEMCRKKQYDLILLDHMMPSPDGIETLHIIRTDGASLNRDTKAVVLTANALAGSRQMYMDEGFDDYLTKPIDAKVLEQTVKDMLPKDKVIEKNVQKTDVAFDIKPQAPSSIKSRLTAIEGLDYNMALKYCGGDEGFLTEIVSDVAASCPERTGRMRKSLENEDYKSYGIEAHTIKSTMATLGLMSLSARAKQHEFAAKGNDIEFILSDAEAFINEYTKVCGKLTV